MPPRTVGQPTSSTYYPALTGLRAVAAFAVFGFHHRNSPIGSVALRAVLSELHIGVSIFFTLSGFLITQRYAGQHFDGAEWRRYLLHRVARIWPVYLLLLAATFLISYPSEGRQHLSSWLTELLVNATLVKGLTERWYLTGIAQSWSLTVEESFYLLAPLVFWLGWRYRPARAWPLLALGLMVGGLGVYALLPGLGSPLFVLKATLFGRLTEFLVGAAFAWRLRSQGRLAPSSGWATVGGAVGMILALGSLVAVQRLTQQVSITTYPGVLLNNLLLPLGTGWLLLGLATEPTRLARLLGSAPAQGLGRASYCFYLLHLGSLPHALQPLLAHWLPGTLGLAVLFGLLVLASLGLHHGFEQPVYRWLLARFSPRVAPASSLLPRA